MKKVLLIICMSGTIFSAGAQDITLPERDSLSDVTKFDTVRNFSLAANFLLPESGNEILILELHRKNLEINNLMKEIFKPESHFDWHLQGGRIVNRDSPYFIDSEPFAPSYQDPLASNYSMRMGVNRYIYRDLYVGLGLEPTVIITRNNKKSFSLRYYGKVGYNF